VSTESRKGRVVRVLGILLVAAAVVWAGVEAWKWHTIDNFGVVEPGRIFRSGQPRPAQLQKLIRENGIRTVINLREPEAPADLIFAEEEACSHAGAREVRLMMPGDGRGTYEQYDEALAILTQPTNLPVLVHCARGSYRSGAVIASYRVRVQGWSEDDAVREMKAYRAHLDDHILLPYLKEYWKSRAGSRDLH
jgi:protein tyrosine/serine phosphatase